MPEMKRKGARSTKDIPRDIMDQLNKGMIATANLVEWLAVDQKKLLANLLEQLDRSLYLLPVLEEVEQLHKQTVNTINEAIGKGLARQAFRAKDNLLFEQMSRHPSDLVRCWATYPIGSNPDLSLLQVLEQIRFFAADTHFGVREISWLSIRKRVSDNLKQCIKLLLPWTTSEDENIRRFAIEVTRPRGVWCAHIESLKADPTLGLALLEPLKSDPSKYVQDSVANWLNDASKTNPGIVIAICERWVLESKTKQTAYIVKRARRTIDQ